MNNLIDFIKENGKLIIIIMIIIFSLLTLFQLLNINLNPPKVESKLVQQVIVEKEI